MDIEDAAEADFICPECGIQFSTSAPEELFDGFDSEHELRVCRRDGRVFIHSKGDVRGYTPEQQAESP